MNNGIIYLIQPAELVSTNRYKIGCSSSPDLKRCNNGYKKGTRYICIMECNYPFQLESKIKCEFNKIFKLIAGKEFFEGDEKIMIEHFITIVTKHHKQEIFIDKKTIIKKETIDNKELYIYSESNSENDSNSDSESNSENDSNSDSDSDLECDLEIDTYDEFLKISNISKIVITDLINKYGYLKFNDTNSTWAEITDTESLYGWLKHNNNHFKINELNYDKIINDICLKCYDEKFEKYKLKYNEYFIHANNRKYYIINTKNFNYTEYDNNINVLTYNDKGSRSLYLNNFENINIDIIDNILNSLINDKNILALYKKICYNVLVEEIEDIIFYDYSIDIHLLYIWLKDLLYTITPFYETIIYTYSFEYPNIDYIKVIKKNKPKIVIIFCNLITTEKQINYIINKIKKLGIKNIYICIKNKNMYNYKKYYKWLNSNKTTIKNNITCNNTDHFERLFLNDLNDIFYFEELLLNNYFKWCCTK